jgi:hypothetical protein
MACFCLQLLVFSAVAGSSSLPLFYLLLLAAIFSVLRRIFSQSQHVFWGWLFWRYNCWSWLFRHIVPQR